jgi:hypothetical protein
LPLRLPSSAAVALIAVLLDFVVIVEGALLLAVVLDADDLVIAVRGLAQHRIDAGPQQVDVVHGRDDDADLRLMLHAIHGFVGAGDLALLDVHVDADAREVVLHGHHAAGDGVGLAFDARARRFAVLAPVVEHVRHVVDGARDLGAFEREVIVLRAVDLRAGQLDLRKRGAADHEHMRDVVLRVEQVGVEIRLENRPFVAAVAQMVLVAVQQVGFRILAHGDHVAVQRIRLDRVVMVHEGEIVALRRVDADIRVLGDAFVLACDDADARIVVLRQHLVDLRAHAARVDEYQLEALVGLRQHGLDHGVQEVRRRAEHGGDDAHQRRIIPSLEGLALVENISRCRAVLLEPFVVARVLRGVLQIVGRAPGEAVDLRRQQAGEAAVNVGGRSWTQQSAAFLRTLMHSVRSEPCSATE